MRRGGTSTKPTNLKLVTNNPGHRPLPQDEPRPDGDAAKPKFLKGRASEIWNEYAPELTRLGLLTSVDGHEFATWCSLAAELERGIAKMTASRIAQMRALAACFGLEPSSRARLGTVGKKSKTEKDEDPASRWFDSGRPG